MMMDTGRSPQAATLNLRYLKTIVDEAAAECISGATDHDSWVAYNALSTLSYVMRQHLERMVAEMEREQSEGTGA